ncbi:hypothetical protein NF27_DC00090 [Candidatus Jidaibacter acanthamoeba]|uniref:DUF6603 domain-containing protein n=1 Tax=Candidatus Jidaibacter acanthamoebae TaxID=86105 RepID=A0A0C1R0A2_9RICK|nr:DUF6603 domain-containing protein [Candidatus Jidaibacter acanthamoeba]KIE05730.1 hypothetical protein NF27_DC00090 [Candidatus Jidaibacter acanthamoeba]
MTILDTLLTNFTQEAQNNNSIVLDDVASYLPVDGFAAIQNAFLISTGTQFIVYDITPDNISSIQNNSFTISNGKSDIYGVTSVVMNLIFSLDTSNNLQIIICASLNSSWTFLQSFPQLNMYPFTAIQQSDPCFIYTTTIEDNYTPVTWSNDHPNDKINLKPGLNFAGWLELSGFLANVLKILNYTDVQPALKLNGPIAFNNKYPYPVMSLAASLGNNSLKIPTGTSSLTLGNTQLVIEITIPTDLGIQEIGLGLIATMQSTAPGSNSILEFEVTIDPDNELLSFSAIPQPGTTFSAADIIAALPGGSKFESFIPSVLNYSLSEVGLNEFAITLSLSSSPQISYIYFSIGIAKSWTIIPDEVTLNDVALSLNYYNPFDTANSFVIVYLDANCSLLNNNPDIFDGTFDFTVNLTENSSQGWDVSSITGQYFGSVSLNNIIQGLFGQGIELPDELSNLQFLNFGVSINQVSDSYAYSLVGQLNDNFIILNEPILSSLNINVNYSNVNNENRYAVDLSGFLGIGGQNFTVTLDFGSTGNSNTTFDLQAAWQAQSQDYLGFNDIAGAFGLDIPVIPSNLDLSLSGINFSYDYSKSQVLLNATSVNYGTATFETFSANGTQAYVFQVIVPTLDNLISSLPLVGPEISSNDLSIKDIDITYATNPTILNSRAIAQGLSIEGGLILAGKTEDFSISTDTQQNQPQEVQVLSIQHNELMSSTSSPAVQSQGTWIPVQKSLGPITLQRIGLNYSNGYLYLLLDGSLNVPDLAINLLELGLGINISDPTSIPKFNLNGLGIALNSDIFTLSGQLLIINPPQNSYKYQFDGEVIAKIGPFGLSILGSYVQEQDDTSSMFMYGVVDVPLGGIPAFFITGGALGFGYNRNLILPSINNVYTYPLVTAAMSPSKNNNFQTALNQMEAYMPVDQGQYWAAAGVTFTSYEMLNSVALVCVTFGVDLEIGLIGLSKAVIPKGDPMPIAQAILQLETTITPSTGIFEIAAQLTSTSYILAPSCHLTGGFAFYLWFAPNEHAGDFVITLGGYHPAFNKPTWYPDIPRLGVNWQVDSNLSLQGKIYGAITPVCMMAGGEMKALWVSGDIRAWFDLNTDIIISWSPYCYNINAIIDVGVSVGLSIIFVNTSINIDVGVDLSLWGPEFNGKAKIKLFIISFTINFGSQPQQSTYPITWDNFCSTFLPQQICTITVGNGLLSTLDVEQNGQAASIWVIDQNDFEIVTSSAIPSKTISLNGTSKEWSTNQDFGVGLVQVSNFTSQHTITISSPDNPNIDIDTLDIEPITINAPKSLWENINESQLNSEALSPETTISNVLSGVTITTKPQTPDATLAIPLSYLMYTVNWQGNVITFETNDAPTSDPFDQHQSLDQIASTNTDEDFRNSLIALLLIPTAINVQPLTNNLNNNYFSYNPRLCYLGEEKQMEGSAND